jgi:hypothetical protein
MAIPVFMRGYSVKVVVFGSFLHVGTYKYGYRVMLCSAGVHTSHFACGKSTFRKHLKIEV